MPQMHQSNQPSPAPALDILRRACRVKALRELETASEWKSILELKGPDFKSYLAESVLSEIDITPEISLREVSALIVKSYIELCRAFEDPGWKKGRAGAKRNLDALDNVLRFLDACETSLPLIGCN